MDFQQLVSNFHGRVLKEPRGFIKILQFIFTICAFATTTSFFSYLKLSVACGNNSTATVTVPLQYSFQLYEMEFKVCEGETKSLTFLQDFSSDSRFFVAVGVLAFLFTVGTICFYTLFDQIYTKDARIPNIDFVAHCVFSILYLAASSAWANGLNGLKAAVRLETIIQENPHTCQDTTCSVLMDPDFSKLNISIILGFLDVFLFASNLWFIYKETNFFAAKDVTNSQPGNGHPTI